jgi:hypothetical protein
MPRKKQTSRVWSENPEAALRDVVKALNSPEAVNWRKPDDHARFLRYVRNWQKSGPDLWKMKIPRGDVPARATDLLRAMEKTHRLKLAPMHDGSAVWTGFPSGPNNDLPLIYFTRLVTGVPWRLGGPCPNCNKWFVKKTERDATIYCSKTCGNTSRQARLRAEKRKELLKTTQRAINYYAYSKELIRLDHKSAEQLLTKDVGGAIYAKRLESVADYGLDDWKRAVSYAAQAYAPEISKNFLTRAVKSGELTPPESTATPPSTENGASNRVGRER